MRWRSMVVRYRLLWLQGNRQLELAAHHQGVAVAEIEVVVETEAAMAVVEEAVETEVVVVAVVVA